MQENLLLYKKVFSDVALAKAEYNHIEGLVKEKTNFCIGDLVMVVHNHRLLIGYLRSPYPKVPSCCYADTSDCYKHSCRGFAYIEGWDYSICCYYPTDKKRYIMRVPTEILLLLAY
jgi:hypothetical protein